jgi:RsiW-degrading membrane proteinase PrsW (M82 family)
LVQAANATPLLPLGAPPPISQLPDDGEEFRLAPPARRGPPNIRPVQLAPALVTRRATAVAPVGGEPSSDAAAPALLDSFHSGTAKLPSLFPQFGPHQSGHHPRRFYLLFVLTLLPLAIHLVYERDDLRERLTQTVQHHPEIGRQLGKGTEADELSPDALLDLLPEHRVEGAYLPRDTWAHWFFGGLALVCALGVVGLLFDRREAKLWHLPAASLFTSTFGIAFLWAIQFLAVLAPSVKVFAFRLSRLLAVLVLLLWLILWMYQLSLDPAEPFPLSLLGFTLGVALCEETVKSLPVWINLRSRSPVRSWQAACIWGLCSGIGYGIAEAIQYSAAYYNGYEPGSIYAVRFISCVALHAIWGGIVSISLFSQAELASPGWEFSDWFARCALVYFPAMFLHGLYDTCLTHDLPGAALATAVASFGVFAGLIEYSYRRYRFQTLAENARQRAAEG